MSKELGDRACASESLDGLACVAAAEGEAPRAARLFGAAEALRETLSEAVVFQHTPEEAAWREPSRARARSRLGEAAWEETLARDGPWVLEKRSNTPSRPRNLPRRPRPGAALHVRASGRAYEPGGRGAGVGGHRDDQRPGRRKALPQPPHRPEAPELRLPQDRGRLPYRGHPLRPGTPPRLRASRRLARTLRPTLVSTSPSAFRHARADALACRYLGSLH